MLLSTQIVLNYREKNISFIKKFVGKLSLIARIWKGETTQNTESFLFPIKQRWLSADVEEINLIKPTCHVMHHQFNIQQLYVLPTLYLCVLCLSENKQRLVPLTA